MTASPLAQTPNDMFNAPIAEADPEIAEILDAELSRQQNGLEMIASENFVPRAVLQAQGSVLTNKYAEGYPGRRYYGGCEQVDKIETIARGRAKSLFGAEYANVQPHSGAQANAAVYQALVKPGDTVLGLALDHGGHLTHGMKINFSGRFYHAEAYGVNPETFRIDPEIIRQRALETHPAMIIGGWSAYPRIEDFKAMKEIAGKAVAFKVAATPEFKDRMQRTLDGAKILAERLMADDVKNNGISVLTGGTDVHLVMVDLRNSEMDGKQGEDLLAQCGITINRNTVPFDPRPASVASGLRIGTSALATRGFGPKEYEEVADIIGTALAAGQDVDVDALKARVDKLAEDFPLYPGLDQIH